MHKVALEGDVSVGEYPWTSTASIGPYSTKTKINGKFIQLKGITHYAEHSHDFGAGIIITHPSLMRVVASGSSDVKIEGHYVARIGDSLADGDTIAGIGSSDTNIGSAPIYLLTEDGYTITSEDGISISL